MHIRCDDYGSATVKRRTVIAATGTAITATIAGCSGMGKSPQYADYDRSDLIPGLEVLPEGWQKADVEDENFDFYENEDGSTAVGFDAEAHGEIGKAEDDFKKFKSKYTDNNDYDLADEAFWTEYQDQVAVVAWRHSDAMGAVAGITQQGASYVPDRATALDVAEKTFEYWKEL